MAAARAENARSLNVRIHSSCNYRLEHGLR
jgi:hypothetical protein